MYKYNKNVVGIHIKPQFPNKPNIKVLNNFKESIRDIAGKIFKQIEKKYTFKNENKKKIVYFVHCIDTEGPLYESLNAKFHRVKEIFNINIKPSAANLKKLKNAKIKLNGKEKKLPLFYQVI